MPYKSKKQQRFMNAVHPDIAARWNKYPMPKYQKSKEEIKRPINRQAGMPDWFKYGELASRARMQNKKLRTHPFSFGEQVQLPENTLNIHGLGVSGSYDFPISDSFTISPKGSLVNVKGNILGDQIFNETKLTPGLGIKYNFQKGGSLPSYQKAATSITGYQGKGPNSGPYIIPDNNITMEGVPFPLTGTPLNKQGKQTGETIPMFPGQNYQFPPGSSVYETPLMKGGGYLPKYQATTGTIGDLYSYGWDTGSTTAGDQAEPLRQKNIYEEARTEGTQIEKSSGYKALIAEDKLDPTSPNYAPASGRLEVPMIDPIDFLAAGIPGIVRGGTKAIANAIGKIATKKVPKSSVIKELTNDEAINLARRPINEVGESGSGISKEFVEAELNPQMALLQYGKQPRATRGSFQSPQDKVIDDFIEAADFDAALPKGVTHDQVLKRVHDQLDAWSAAGGNLIYPRNFNTINPAFPQQTARRIAGNAEGFTTNRATKELIENTNLPQSFDEIAKKLSRYEDYLKHRPEDLGKFITPKMKARATTQFHGEFPKTLWTPGSSIGRGTLPPLKPNRKGGYLPQYQSSRDPIPDSLDSNILDVDEDTLNELVNAGADIERIPDIDMSQVKQATIKPTPRTLGHKIEDWWKKPQEYNVPKLNLETGEWEDKPYYTSFADEWERTGLEPTFTFTSAGGPGIGSRIYLPYSDPVGLGFEIDVDPTGPGGGILANNYRLRQFGNYLADKIGDNSVGNWFQDLNLPPGFTYAGVEMAGNAPMPFVGATVSLDDTERLQEWVEHPDNSGLNTFAEGMKHALGPGLWGWNQGPKIGGQFKISNPADVMGKPLWKSPDLFGGKKIPNIISGTGEGMGRRMGIKGANIVPKWELPGFTKYMNPFSKFKEPFEASARGGFEAMKNDVLALAKEKGITPKAAYSELAGTYNMGKHINKTGIPKVLDYAGEKLYGTKGPGRYDKAGTTVANTLRNMKIPYGKVINHPWFWKGLSSVLMAPDAANTLSGMFHQPGDPIKDYWRTFSDDQYGLGDPELQSAQQYGPFPRVQRFFDPEVIAEDRFNEAKDKVTWFDASGRPRTEAEDPTTDKFVSKEMKHKQEIGEAYEKTVTKKHGVAPKYDWKTAKTRQGVWYDKEGYQVKVPEGAKFEKRKREKEKYGWEASYFDEETGEWVDLWSYDVPALRGAQKDVTEESNKKTAERRKKALSDTPDIFKKGGEIIDIDDELLKELISKNADIEIL